jgi:hypothetical protein
VRSWLRGRGVVEGAGTDGFEWLWIVGTARHGVFGGGEVTPDFGGEPEPPRLDDLFVHGSNGSAQSQLVFTPLNPTAAEQVNVSDHRAVLTSIRVP